MDNEKTVWISRKGLQAVCMTHKVIEELERQTRKSRDSLQSVLEPEIERLDMLQRASERLLPSNPERWQNLSELYSELGDLLRSEAGELEAEIGINEALIEALRDELEELEAMAFQPARARSGR